jgi:hemolysin III
VSASPAPAVHSGSHELRPRLRGWLHAAAAPVALVGTFVLASRAALLGAARVPALIFGLCLVALFTISSLYHVGRWSDRVRFVLGRFDQAAIQLTIVGTFTPVAFHALSGSWRSWSLAAAWAIAVVGIAVSSAGFKPPRWVGAVAYISFGWLGVIPFTRMIGALPWQAGALIALGGVLYTIGAVVYATRRPDPFPRWFGYHEVFHLLVVAASTAHYLAIWRYVLPIG